MGCLYLSPHFSELISFGTGTFSAPLETVVQIEERVSVAQFYFSSSFLSLAQTLSQPVPLSCPSGESFFCYVNVVSYHTVAMAHINFCCSIHMLWSLQPAAPVPSPPPRSAQALVPHKSHHPSPVLVPGACSQARRWLPRPRTCCVSLLCHLLTPDGQTEAEGKTFLPGQAGWS